MSTLHELSTQYILVLKLEDTISKQKTHQQWFKEGETNSKYFLSLKEEVGGNYLSTNLPM